MSDRKRSPAPEPKDVYCRRLERPLPTHEHLDCAYCFGTRPQVLGGDHQHFCDFEPGRDPIQFGFPDGYGA